MEHLIDNIFTYDDQDKLLDLAYSIFGDFYTGDQESVRLAFLLRAKLLLVDRKGVNKVRHYERLALSNYLNITDAEDFLGEYTETLNIDDITCSECGYDYMHGDGPEAVVEEIETLERDIDGLTSVLKLTGHTPVLPTNELDCGKESRYDYLEDWANLVREFSVLYLYNNVLAEDSNADLTVLSRYVEILPTDVLYYVSDPIGEVLNKTVTSYKTYCGSLK